MGAWEWKSCPGRHKNVTRYCFTGCVTEGCYKSFMLKAQTALATGHFSNQLGSGSAVTPPPSISKDVHYKSGTWIFSTKKDVQYEQAHLQHKRGCAVCTRHFISTNEHVHTNKGHHQVLGMGALVKATFE